MGKSSYFFRWCKHYIFLKQQLHHSTRERTSHVFTRVLSCLVTSAPLAKFIIPFITISTPWVTLQEADIMRRTLEAACWLRLGYWSNNSTNSHPSPGVCNRRVLRSCLVPQCSYPPYRPRHQRRLANCDLMPAAYTSGQPSNLRRHPTCWASSQ